MRHELNATHAAITPPEQAMLGAEEYAGGDCWGGRSGVQRCPIGRNERRKRSWISLFQDNMALSHEQCCHLEMRR